METPPNDPEGQPSPSETGAPLPGGESPVEQPDSGAPPVAPPADNETSGYKREGQSDNLPPGAAGTFIPPNVGGGYQDYGASPPNYANYPRYFPSNRGPVPPGPAIIRFAALSEAWELVRQDFGTYVLSMLIIGIVGYAVSFVFQLPAQLMMMNPANLNSGAYPFSMFPHTAEFWVLYIGGVIISNIVQTVLGAGMFSLCLRRLRGEAVNISNAFDGLKSFLPLAVAGVCCGLIQMVATLLFIVPGIFALGAFVFVPMIVMDQRAGPIEAMAISFTAVKKDMFMMGVLAIVALIVGMIGAIACCVGALFTIPIYFMTLAIHYHAYFPPQGGPQPYGEFRTAPQYSI